MGIFGIVLGIIMLSLSAFAAPTTLTYQGRIINENGLPLEHSSVSFEFTLTNPTGTCVLYREQKNGVDMRNSKGIFDTAIGTGTKLFPASASVSLLDVFSNAGVLSCEGGATYVPNLADGRMLRVQFFDGAGWKLISPDSVIRSVPFSLNAANASRLGDVAADQFVTKTNIPTCTAGEVLTASAGGILVCTPDTAGSGFTDVAGGDLSGNYPSPIIAANAVTTAKILNGSVTSAKIADGTILPADLAPGSSAGQVLRFDGASWQHASLNFDELQNSNGLSPWPAAACGTGQFLTWVSSTDTFDCQSLTSTMINTSLGFVPVPNTRTITAGTGLTGGGNLSADRTLAVNVGTGAGQIPQLDGSGKLAASVVPDALANGAWTASAGDVYRATGNVGIGVTGPTEKLEVDGTMKATGICIGTDCRTSWPSGAGGSVTSVSVTTANGFAGTVSTSTTTPAITISTNVTGLVKGNGSALSAATVGTDYSAGTSALSTGLVKSTTGTGALTIAGAADITAALGSQSAATVFAAPNSAAGAPTFRALKIEDIKSGISGNFLAAAAACPAGQTLTYLAAADNLSCQPYTLNTGAVSSSHIVDGTITSADLATSITNGLWAEASGNVNRPTGNVGIGVASPGKSLDVNGGVRANEFCIGASCITTWPSGAGSTAWADITGKPATYAAGGTAGGDLSGTYPSPAIANGVVTASKLDSAVSGNLWAGGSGNVYRTTGSVGIGTSSPGSALHVNGTVRLDQICDQAGSNCRVPSSILTGIDSGQVTTALGYTPVNKAGDAMTGRLNLSSSGLHIATKDNITTRTDSGFFQTSAATVANGWPTNSGWYHLLSTTHSNDANYYSMQFAGNFNNQGELYYRNTNNNGAAPWSRIWTSGNLTNLSQLNNGPGYLTGVSSGQVTGALGFTPLGNTSTSGQSIAYTNAGGPQVLGAGGGASMLSFHRPGSYAVNFGLDTDNVLKVGGWSMGAVAHTLWHSGNFNPGSKLTLDAWNGSSYIATDGRHYGSIFYDSNDTNYYVDPNSTSQMYNVKTMANWDGLQGGLFMQGNAPTITMQDNDNGIRWMMHQQDDRFRFYRASTAWGTDWAQKLAILNDGDIWSAKINDNIFNRLGQDVRAGTSPNFSNIWLGYNASWLSDILNQDVRHNSSPYFNNPQVAKIRASTSNNVWPIESGGPIAFDGGLISRNVNNQMAFIIQGSWPGGAGWFWRRLNDLNNYNSGYTDPMVLDPAGTLWVKSGYTQASDIRLKKDFEKIPDSLRRLTQLEGLYYHWKDTKNQGDKRQIGLIAQEVEKIFPEIVSTNKEGYKAVSYQQLVAPIINALREIRDWMTGTDVRVTELEAENKLMKDYLCGKDPEAPFCKSSRAPASAH